MSNILDDVLASLQPITFSGGVIKPTKTTFNNNGEEIFSINLDGSVDINPTYTVGHAADLFWQYIANQSNIVQLAVEKAKKDEREACAQLVENQGRGWGLLRSMRMTHFAEAAKKLAALIRN